MLRSVLFSRVNPSPLNQDLSALQGTFTQTHTPPHTTPTHPACRRFFAALSSEPPGVRAAVQEATSSLANAFRYE